MAGIWLVGRAQLRDRWPSTVALALLIGLGAGTVIATVAGVRRNDRALPEFVEFSRETADVAVFGAPPDPDAPEAFNRYDQAGTVTDLQQLPAVRSTVRATALIVQGQGEHGGGTRRRLLLFAALDPGKRAAVGRWKVVEGRDLDELEPDEVVVGETFAAREGLRPGSTYRVAAFTLDQFGPAGEGAQIAPDGDPVDLRVVGIVRTPLGLVPGPRGQDSAYTNQDELYVAAGYWRSHGPDIARYGIGVAVTLAPDVTVEQLESQMREEFGPDALETRFQIERGSLAGAEGRLEGVRRAISIQSRSLLGFALVAALATFMLMYQTLGRQLASEARAVPVLMAIGMSRRAAVLAMLLRLGPAAVLAGIVAAITEVVASPLTPIGIARRAELHPGVEVDLPVMLAGSGITVSAVLVAGLLGSWRAVRSVRRQQSTPAPTPWTSVVARLPVAAATGLRLATRRGGGVGAAPVRTAMSAVAAAAVVISALAGVTTSFDRLISSPEHYGITWHAAAGNFASSEADHEGAARLAANPDIEAFAGVNHHEYLIGEDGATALVLGMDLSQRQGRLEPVITRGRSPRGADEVAVGAVTMRRLGIALGDTIRVRVTGAGKPLHVVGQVVLNDASLGFLQPGKGVLVDAAAAAALDPNQADDPASQAFVIRFTREVNRGAAIARLRGDFPQTVVSPFPASDINNLQRISTLPAALAVLVALLGAGAIAHAIAVTVHRRRRDLAVLRCLGFRTRDISVTVACQASAMGIAGLVVGIPLGAAVGRVIWRLLADQVGVAAAPVTPLVLILSICAAALVAVNVAAAVPAVAARRLRAADILRSPG